MTEVDRTAEAKTALYAAARLRVPNFQRPEGEARMSPRSKVEALEDHLLLCARHRGDLEESRLFMAHAVKLLEDQWDKIEGWEVAKKSGDKTQRAERDAKRKLRPDLYDGIREGKWIIARLTDQIERLERDEEKVISRVYTFISG